MIEPRQSGDLNKSDEFALAVECCRHSFRHGSETSASSLQTVDWQRLLKIVRFHRIEGIAWNYLAPIRSQLPDAVAVELSSAASKIAANSLRAVQDCRRLMDSFEAAGLSLLFLKGLPLGALAYGNPALKSSIDIDLLIDADQLLAAATILRTNGYRLVAPAKPSDGDLKRWHRGWKESVWRNDETAMQLDLHTRTADNDRLIPNINVRSPRQDVLVGGRITLPTLADGELFAYLTVHGASSAWFRLKWAADFGGFLSGKSGEALEHLYRRSQALGAGRAPGMALLLADRLFETLDRNPDLRGELRRDPEIVRLYRTSLHLLLAGPDEPTASRLGTLPIHMLQLGLLPGPGYMLSEIWRQTRRFLDRPPV